eukprot:751546-Hanusia_phi.AAC.4
MDVKVPVGPSQRPDAGSERVGWLTPGRGSTMSLADLTVRGSREPVRDRYLDRTRVSSAILALKLRVLTEAWRGWGVVTTSKGSQQKGVTGRAASDNG